MNLANKFVTKKSLNGPSKRKKKDGNSSEDHYNDSSDSVNDNLYGSPDSEKALLRKRKIS
jgi:hypothetical protein